MYYMYVLLERNQGQYRKNSSLNTPSPQRITSKSMLHRRKQTSTLGDGKNQDETAWDMYSQIYRRSIRYQNSNALANRWAMHLRKYRVTSICPKLLAILTHSLIHHFEIVPNSKKLQLKCGY